MHRTWGGIVAGTLFVLPSLLLIILLSWIYLVFGQQPLVAAFFSGIKPAVVAIVVQAALRIGGRVLHLPWLWVVAIAAFFALAVAEAPFPLVVGLAAGLGVLGGRWRPAVFQGRGGHAGRPAPAVDREALLADTAPPPAHTRFSRRWALRIALAGGLLWSLPLLLIGAVRGWEDPLAAMGVFFTKAALLTFGGAYAVLPYVHQGAVEHYGWLTTGQMIDGLALGETTPGPLVMIVAFVGFIGGYLRACCDAVDLFLAGALAAGVATWFTFLPSFLFILLGGPLVEATRDDLKFTAPLTAISAAVVGVIANLAVFFAGHVFWPAGWAAAVDGLAVIIAVVAGVVLLRGWAGVIPVILACGLAGLIGRGLLA